MLFPDKLFPPLARAPFALALIIFSCSLLACSNDNGKESRAVSAPGQRKEAGAENKITPTQGNAPQKGERLNMKIVEPDFDRGMAQPEIKVEKRKGSALDF